MNEVHGRLRRAADVLDELQPPERNELLGRQIFAFRTLADHLEQYGQWGVAPCCDGLLQAADAVLEAHSLKRSDEWQLLRAAVRPCVPMVRECQPPGLGVQVLGQTLLLSAAHPGLVRADMIVLRGNAVQVVIGSPEDSWAAALDRWGQWSTLFTSLAGAVFLACVRVMPCATVICDRDIFGPLLGEGDRP
jgi:hypothetical protein